MRVHRDLLSPLPGGGRQSEPGEAAPSPPFESKPSTMAAAEVLGKGSKRALEAMGDGGDDPKELDALVVELAEYPDQATHERPRSD